MTDFGITKSTIISYSVKERRLHYLSLKCVNQPTICSKNILVNLKKKHTTEKCFI